MTGRPRLRLEWQPRASRDAAARGDDGPARSSAAGTPAPAGAADDAGSADAVMAAAEQQADAADDAEMLESAVSAQDAVQMMEEAAEEAAAVAEETGGLGRPGRAFNRRSPFFIGMAAAAGVGVTYIGYKLVIKASAVLVLIGLAIFIAAGLDPAVTWLTKHRLPRWAAVLVVLAGVAAIIGVFLAAAIPPIAKQTSALASELPHYEHVLRDHNSTLGRLVVRYHLEQDLTHLLQTKGSALIGGVVGAGALVLGALASMLVVAVLSVYFLASLPRVKLFVYRLAPRSRRTRVILIGDEIFTKVGGFVLGNVVTSVIAGLGTFFWLFGWRVPYPLLLALLVALLDLIPVIGSTIGGAIASLVALTVSLPVALATVGFYIAYRLAEDYLLVPRIMGRAVQVPAIVTVVSVLVGGALMGIIGALVAIPAAAAIRLLLQEIAFRRLDRT